MRNENKGCEHHRKIPIIDPAFGTASVFHKPCLEGTEKENADHIANAVGKAYKNKNAGIDNPEEIKKTEQSVERKPRGGNGKGAFPGMPIGLGFALGLKVALELLLATHAFEPRRKKAEKHLYCINDPDNSQNKIFDPESAVAFGKAMNLNKNVDNKRREKQSRSIDQLEIMHRHYC